MAGLSNFLLRGNARPSGKSLVCRPALRARGEIEAGLRLILGSASGPADDEAVLDFLSVSVRRRIDVNQLWVADLAGRVVWALLPIVSPGRTMLLLTPGRLPRQTPSKALQLLSDAVCEHFARQQIVLSQILLDPGDRIVRQLYQSSGFESLAELIYLNKPIGQASEFPPLNDGWELDVYSPSLHDRFADVIARSYLGSMDCPGLNGRRDIEDVIAGHRATGMFDPSLWFILSERGEGRGVVLLNPTFDADGAELVYLGVAPEARGREIGDLLMRLATARLAGRGLGHLSLAVDARNRPALRLYYRHGMKRVGSRIALIRDCRPCPPSA